MKLPQLKQSTYMRLLSVLFLVISFASFFSFGYTWGNVDPGARAVKLCFCLIYFMGFWYFFNVSQTLREQEFEMPTEEEADEIIKSWNKPKKGKVTTSKGAHKSVHK